jgi:hypothetical protein
MNPDERPNFQKICTYLKAQMSPGEAENEEWMSDEAFILGNSNQLSTCN